MEQLAYIGAISLLYNDVETVIDETCALVLHAPFPAHEITSRINGIDGKIALIKLGAPRFDEEETKHLEDVLGGGGFKLLKSWRDAVIHARMLDARTALGRVPERQGRISEVLLSLAALEGLFRRLDWMRSELSAIRSVMSRRFQLIEDELNEFKFELSDQGKEQLERGIQAEWLQARAYRTERQSLPPIPEFPEEMSAAEWVVESYQTLSESLKATGGLQGKERA